MNQILKFFKFGVKFLVWLAVVILMTGALLLYVISHRVPDGWVRFATDHLSTEKCSIRIDRVSFSLSRGLHLIRPAIYYHGKPRASDRVFYAEEILVEFNSFFPFEPKKLIDKVKIRGLRAPGIPSSVEVKPSGKTPLPTLAKLAPIDLVFEDALIMGIYGKSLHGVAYVDEGGIAVRDIEIAWYGNECPGGVKAWVDLDFKTRLVTTRIVGEALPSYIVPLMGKPVLDAPIVEAEMNAFQSVEPPVKASADIAVNIDNLDYSLFLGIDAKKCSYKGVPVHWLKGTLSAGSTNIYTYLTVGPLEAMGDTGPFKGWLQYEEEGETLSFSADAKMDIPDVFDIIGILNEGELDMIRYSVVPTISASGKVSVEREKGSMNRIKGKIAFPSGSILNLSVKDAVSDFIMEGYTARFENAYGRALHGGSVEGTVLFRFPGYREKETDFTADLQLKNIDLVDLSKMANVTNSHVGKVSGYILLRSKVSNDSLKDLNGNGKILLTDGVIVQMPIFAGFTDYLVKTIPGIDKVVNQSRGSMSFTVKDGVMKTDDLLIEGNVFSLSGRGSYDIVRDKVDFVVRANIFKKRSLMGKITHFVTFPFTRLLLEFHVFGSLDKVDWSYVTILDKITDTISKNGKSRNSDSRKRR